jgi:diacylglycerol kinase (ATP)
MIRTILIFNPNAGQASQLQPQLDRAVQLWQDAGWQVDRAPTEYSGHATIIARQAAADGYDYAIAAGGDGTVNEVMNGLIHSNTALGTLPIGTINIWAREMGLPMDILGAARQLLTAQIKTIDVGQTRQIIKPIKPAKELKLADQLTQPLQTSEIDRAFLLMAGIGFDAAVTETVDVREKKKLGAIAYVKQAIQLAWQFRGVRTLLRIDGKRVRGRILMIIIGNSQLYGGVVKMTAHAIVDDGLLDVCVIKGRSMLVAPFRLFSIFTRNYNRDPKVAYFKAKRIDIQGKKKLPIQIDGDFLGRSPMQFEIIPRSLRVLVPANADRSLWSQPEAPCSIEG